MLAAPSPADAQPADLIEVVEATPTRRVTGLAPGDSLNWAFTLRNVADEPLAVAISVETPDALGPTGRSQPFLLRADLCSLRWVETPDPVTGAPTYRCDGTITAVSNPDTVAVAVGAELSVRAVATLSPGVGSEREGDNFGEIRLVAVATLADLTETEVLTFVDDARGASGDDGRGLQPVVRVVGPGALAGLAFLLLGWRLLAARRRRRQEGETVE